METVRAMTELIACEVFGRQIDRTQYAFSDEELARLYRLSKAHDLAHLVGDVLIKNALIQNAEIKAKFEKQRMLAVYRYERINYELCRLRDALNGAKIPFIPLKGAVLRGYYPEMWMRTSCDIDILVPAEQAEAAAQHLVSRLQYTYVRKNYHDISLMSDSGVHLELHFSLHENEANIDGTLSDCWRYAAPQEGYAHSFTPEFFLFHQFAHAYYHFLHGGCGVRIFLDLQILNQRMPFDRETLAALLEKCGILKFANEAAHLADVWFGAAAHTALSAQMERYILGGGVYGTANNRIAVQQVRTGGKIRYALSRIWLPYDVLRRRYPSLEGKKVLLPLYEARRWCKLLFCGGVKRSVNELKMNSATTNAEQAKTKEMLSELGIDY